MDNGNLSSIRLLDALRTAVGDGQLKVYYQPRVDIRTGDVVGAEALLRWSHPTLGSISPAAFIPIAEETGLILPIGEWTLRQACAQAAAWRTAGFDRLVVSVNLSPRQFAQGDVVDTVWSILRETELPPQQLELEITESITMDVESAIATLNRLKRLGVRISVDDFGTGYSSLSYLKRFPLHTLKIDKTFIRECTKDENDATIVRTIIAMAHNLNLRVVAEGVETKEQLVFLQRHLCDEAQGFLFQRPVPPEELVEQLEELPAIVTKLGVGAAFTEKMLMREQLRNARRDLEETLRMQQGLTFKFKKVEDRFVITLCGGQLLRRFGVDAEAVVGKTVEEIAAPDEVAPLYAQYQRAWDGEEEVTFEAKVLGVWCLASLTPIRRGGVVVEVVGSAIDISERKRAEEALNRVHKQYELIVENVTDLISVFDADGDLTYASPSHLRLLGYTPESLLGMDVQELVHPEDVSGMATSFEEGIKMKSEFQCRSRFRHKDGIWVLVEVRGMPVMDDDGRLLQMVTVSRPVHR
ncbi:EAL domain-containing protein [Paenibacillus antri]|uniref:EAL domain-containing protein n=1 Tax=Paenibacillus antri TaxID=2582848 RepID=A0A5R9GAL9_9BACL|nr:EAL domain-containing protein [Paenibacillus antri]TLS52109.1 EAL domain-containing protein [Paenibacillus antri]